jgi:hypothetical protein
MRARGPTLFGVAGEVCRRINAAVGGQDGEQIVDANRAIAGDVGTDRALQTALPSESTAVR